MNVLFLGDLVGESIVPFLEKNLPPIIKKYNISFVIVNGENLADGYGTTPLLCEKLFDIGIDVISSGNHIWDQREIFPSLDGELPIIRPANYPSAAPGKGVVRIGGVVVINLQGRVFMPEGTHSPWVVVDDLLDDLSDDPPKVILVDFHTEATSEQNAMGWYLDGRVSALVGTHTHVPTADTKLLPRGTAYVTDLGMTGPVNSIIGSRPDDVLSRFLTAMPKRLNVAEGGPAQFNSVLIQIDEQTGMANDVRRIDRILDETNE